MFLLSCNGFVCKNNLIKIDRINRINNPILRSNNLFMNYKPTEIIKTVAKTGLGGEWTYNDFLENIKNNNIDSATITNTNNFVFIDKNYNTDIMSDNLHLLQGLPQLTDSIIHKLIEKGINFDVLAKPENTDFFSNLPFGVQFVCFYLIGSFILNILARRGIMNNMMNGGIPNLNKNSKIINSNEIDVRFSDVAGCDESKYELMEVVEFLKNPEKFKDSGAIIPSGILLEGPPGTGKTLLARAVAGEAGVSFISVSGSEFIEMFVGVGASRVRNLFKQAKENSPTVIFIDEIDAIGRQRGAGLNSGNDEREQTLNQILTNMDGFDKTSGIVVLAATNRADILDSALTRPGRFDRKVIVTLPDQQGRKDIFNIHLKNKKYKNIDLDQFSELTSGFSGADIFNLVNEAAILSIRYNKTHIDNECIYNAFEKVTIGLPLQKDSRNEEIKKLVAYHEAGHTIMAKLFKDIFEVRKVTINANNNGAGGYTLFTQREKYAGFPTKKLLLAQLMVSLGGRVAEIILFNRNNNTVDNYNNKIVFNDINNLDITTGASNDLKQADSIARTYINLFGFNDTYGTINDNNPSQPFLGRDIAMNTNKISEYSKNKIDKEVNKIVNFAFEKTVKILTYNEKNLDSISLLLLNQTSIDSKLLDNYNIKYFA